MWCACGLACARRGNIYGSTSTILSTNRQCFRYSNFVRRDRVSWHDVNLFTRNCLAEARLARLDNLCDCSHHQGQFIVPILEHSWIQAKLTSQVHANMANTFFSHCSSCNESIPHKAYLFTVYVITVHVTSESQSCIQSPTVWALVQCLQHCRA